MAKIYYDPDTFELSDKPKNYHGLELPEGFVPWFGGEQPKDSYGNTKIIVRADIEQRRPEMYTGTASYGEGLRWTHNGWGGDIIAYRPSTYIPIPDGFIKWDGKDAVDIYKNKLLHDKDVVKVIFRNGSTSEGKACDWDWSVENVSADIIAYKVVGKYVEPVVKGCYVVDITSTDLRPLYVYKVLGESVYVLDEELNDTKVLHTSWCKVVKGA